MCRMDAGDVLVNEEVLPSSLPFSPRKIPGLTSSSEMHRSLQGYLAHEKMPPPPSDPTVALCVGPYGVPGGVVVSYERGTPVGISFRRVSGSLATSELLGLGSTVRI